MGREIRMVPPNWEHPREQTTRGEEFKPLCDKDTETAYADWCQDYQDWLNGEHDRVISEYGATEYPKDEPYRSFCIWHGSPPDPKYYRPKWKEGEATWFQVYETVSEGTPVTPPFATKEELIEYLCTHGDFWDQSRRARGVKDFNCGPWSRKAAEKFVNAGYAPSIIVTSIQSGVTITQPRDGGI